MKSTVERVSLSTRDRDHDSLQMIVIFEHDLQYINISGWNRRYITVVKLEVGQRVA